MTADEDENDDIASGNATDEDESESEPNGFIPEPVGELINCPHENDVICGRGKSVAHPGNLRFRQIILARKDDYRKAYRRDLKTKIKLDIVDELRQGKDPARFLLKDMKTKLWYDAGENYAREKVSHALRSRPNEERRKRPKQTKKAPKKPKVPPELEATVHDLIKEQQQLLKSLIENDNLTGGRTGQNLQFDESK